MGMPPGTRIVNGKKPHAEVMSELKRRLRRIHDVLQPSAPVVYIDYPMHGNIGDLMIHAGADAFLEDYGYDVVGRYSGHELASAKGDGPLGSIHEIDRWMARGASIVLHGGGNVGDLWPHHQRLREFLICRYPDAPVVFFPQSVHFDNAAARARSAEVLRRHGNITFFVRDRESLEFADKECRCRAEVLPDMAHQLWDHPSMRASVEPATCSLLVQRRRDKERAQAPLPDTFDWDDLRGPPDRLLRRVIMRCARADHRLRRALPFWGLWRRVRDRLIRRAARKFSAYDSIDTDRLHGVILGALLERQVMFRDNYYGKVSRYYDLWMAESDHIRPADAERQVSRSEVRFEGATPVLSSPSGLSLR